MGNRRSKVVGFRFSEELTNEMDKTAKTLLLKKSELVKTAVELFLDFYKRNPVTQIKGLECYRYE